MRCRPQAAALVALAVVMTFVLSSCTRNAQPATARQAAATPAPVSTPSPSPQPPDPPVVLFLGDSYATGIHGVTVDQTYASVAARLLGWQVIVGGHSGTGFVNTGSVHKNFAQLYAKQMEWRPAPDLMIVSGGHNDWPYKPKMVGAAVEELLRTIAQRWPYTQTVVVGPIWGGDPRPEVRPVRNAIRAAAERMNVPFIDPLAERWFTGNHARGTGNAARLILPDGTHPTLNGHRYMGHRLAEDLRKLHLTEGGDGTSAAQRPTPRHSATRALGKIHGPARARAGVRSGS